MSDHDLVRAALLGDTRCAEGLLLRYEEALRQEIRAGAWQLRNSVDADDMLQAFFVRVCEKGFRALAQWHGLTDPGITSIEPYFRQIMRNLLRDEGRRRRAIPEDPDDVDDGRESAQVDQGEGPEEIAATRELRLAMAQCIATALNPRQRQVIALHLEDREHAEIAATLGVTEGNSRVLLKRALDALKRCMTARLRNADPARAVRE
jgi:RNA polymerase sigma factor (sigma-70 family)